METRLRPVPLQVVHLIGPWPGRTVQTPIPSHSMHLISPAPAPRGLTYTKISSSRCEPAKRVIGKAVVMLLFAATAETE